VPSGDPGGLVTAAGESRVAGVSVESLRRVPLFADLSARELKQIAKLFKRRTFAAGDTVVQEGSGGAAFYVIESGEATVTIGGEENTTLRPGDYFGEIALIDEGARMATITATGDLACFGLTYWDFRPVVEANGAIGWNLLQSMTRMYREARQR
jgi:CRP/FNR family transcriptional regulator, cyclic AMP receptor protein